MTYSSDVSAGNDIYANDLNKLRKDVMLGGRVNEDVAGAASITLDFSDVDNGNIKSVTLDQNTTIAFSGITVYPTVFFVRFVQDASGGHTVTLPSGIKYPGGSAPTISDGANEVTGLMFICTAAGVYDCYYAGFDLSEP